MIKFFKHSFLLLICLSCLSMYSHAAPIYKLVDLGLQESDKSEAVAVNDLGQVAGAYWMFGNKYYFLWNDRDGISLLNLPETATIIVLNNIGQIAGNYQNKAGKNRGFIWDPSKGFSDIGTLGGDFTRVYDMNDLGQVVGESESSNFSLVDGGKEQHAFMWQNTLMVDLGALTGDLGFLGDRSVATNINNHGQIIGTSNCLIAHKVKLLRSNNRAVAWIDGVINEVGGSLEPQYGAWAFSINNNGLATYYQNNEMGWYVVDLFTMNKSGVQHMSYWAVHLNDNDDVFVYPNHNYNFDKKIADIAYFKKNENNFEDFRVYDRIYFGNSYENPKQWRSGSFSGAYDFNNKRWVVGIAENIYGEHHGVLLVPIDDDSRYEEVVVSAPKESPEDHDQGLSEGSLELLIQESIDAAFIYHTAGIGEKVRLLFLEAYAQNPSRAKYVQEPYRISLMIEALDGIFAEIENLSTAVHCESNIWFWETVRSKLCEKSSDWRQSVEAYIKLKIARIVQ